MPLLLSELVLASGSPRRRQLLASCHVPFRVVAPEIAEVVAPGELPTDFVLRMAREKGAAVSGSAGGCPVLSADTVVALDDRIFGKPADLPEAREMLEALSGRIHSVLTGVVLRVPSGDVFEEVDETRVCFETLDGESLERLLVQEEILDKAGAYAIQGVAGAFVPTIRGNYSNVVGLPLPVVFELLRRAGLP